MPANLVRSPDDACYILGVKNMALTIGDCHSVSPCLPHDTLNAFGLFYMVSMSGEVKYPTHGY